MEMEILTQPEVDDLIEAINNDKLEEWKSKNPKSRFEINICIANDYDLFYSSYPLEELTTNMSILRRYAYKDKSFKQFKYFIVIENYKYRKSNAVSVVGVLPEILTDPDYDYISQIKNGKVYLVDFTSLSYILNMHLPL